MQADSFSRQGAGPMKERLQHLLSEAGERFDSFKSAIRHLSRYRAELEALLESSRAFAATATLSARGPIGQRSASFSARTHTIIGPPPDTLAETRPELAQCEDLVTE
jgi:hypothetical protein